jgi:hypothetical protein
MIDYILDDFIQSRTRFGDQTIGAMVVCDNSEQAIKLFEIFINKYNLEQKPSNLYENTLWHLSPLYIKAITQTEKNL